MKKKKHLNFILHLHFCFLSLGGKYLIFLVFCLHSPGILQYANAKIIYITINDNLLYFLLIFKAHIQYFTM